MKLRGIILATAIAAATAYAQVPPATPDAAPGAADDAMEMQAPPPGPGPDEARGPGGPGGERGERGGRVQGRGPAMMARGGMRGPGGPMGPHGMGAPRIEALKTYLKLTDEQVKSVQALFDERDKKTREAFHQTAEKRRALMQSLHQPGDDPNTSKQALEAFQATHKQIDTVNKEFRDKLAAALKPEQLSQLKDLEKAAALQRAIFEAQALGLIDGAGPMGGGPRGMMRPPAPHAPPTPLE